jgi:hypothetical protein
MATKDIEIDYNFTQGLGLKEDEFISKKLEVFENATLTELGTPTQRNGFTAAGKQALFIFGFPKETITNGSCLDEYNDELLLRDSSRIYSYLESTNEWIFKGGCSTNKNSKKSIFSSGTDTEIRSSNFSRLNNVEINVFRDSASPIFKSVVRDLSTNATIGTNFNHASSAAIAFSFNGVNGIITHVQLGPTGFIQIHKWNNINLSYDAAVTLASDALISSFAYIDIIEKGNNLLIGYFPDAGDQLNLIEIDNTFSIIQTGSISGGTGTLQRTRGVTVSYDPTRDEVYTVYIKSDGSNDRLYYGRLSTALAVIDSAILINTSAGVNEIYTFNTGVLKGNSFYVYYSATVSPVVPHDGYSFTKYAIIDVTVPSVNSIISVLNYQQVTSKCFIKNDKVYVWLTQGYEENTKTGVRQHILINEENTVVSKCLMNKTLLPFYTGLTFYELLTNIIIEGDDVYSSFAEVVKTTNDTTKPLNKTSLNVFKTTFNSTKNTKAFKFGKGLYIPAACPYFYDGKSTFEYGFLNYPELYQFAIGAGAIPAGAYTYVATYEYIDKNGVVHVSEPSTFKQVVFGGPTTYTIAVRPLSISQVGEICNIKIYRTEANTSGVFYLLTTLLNSTSSYFLTFADNTLDSALVDGEPFYFNGETLENAQPNTAGNAAIYKNRIFSSIDDDENRIQYTKEYSPNFAAGNNEFLQLGIEDTNQGLPGQTNSVHALDDKLLFFKEDSISFIVGDGPNNAGANDSFTRPQLITQEIGCINPKSIVSTPFGVMFQSLKGIYLISRNLESVFIGEDVETFKDLEITSAIILDKLHLVVMTTNSQTALVFDYLSKQWSTFTNYEAVDCVLWKSKICHLKSDGTVNIENTTFDDNGSFIPQKITTAWLNLEGLQRFSRFKRIMILGKYKNDHLLKVSFQYDYQKYIQQEITYQPLPSVSYNITTKPSNADLYNGTNDGVYQFKGFPEKQKCQSVKITIETLEGLTIGESVQLTNISFLVGLKKGPFKTQSEKQQ